MDPIITGSLISAGAGLAGGLFGGKGMSNKEAYNKMEEQAYISRKEIPLRIQAYKDAGIHPLYSISGSSFTPSVVTPTNDNSMADGIAQAGQHLGRAYQAYATTEERAYSKAHQTLTLENMALQNDLLKSQITSIHAPSNPAFPSASSLYGVPGQGDSRSLPGFDSDGGADASVSSTRNGNSLAVVPSTSVKNRIEDMIIPEVQWYMRQLMSPKLPGYTYNPITSEMVPDSKSKIRKFLDMNPFNPKNFPRNQKR